MLPRKRILLLTTGGTIASVPGGQGLEPKDSAVLDREIRYLRNYYDVIVEDLMCLDSSNIRPVEWQKMARRIFESRQDYDGIVVSHGTDTMAYSASAVSFMLQDIDLPVVFTGSQIPLCMLRSDGLDNIVNAILIAASGRVHEVCLYFGGRLLRGNLRQTGHDEAWLQAQLSENGVDAPSQVFLLSIDERGKIICIVKDRAK